MDIKRVQEVFGEDDDSITRDDDSIPLADENPSDVLEESLISDDKRKVITKMASLEDTLEFSKHSHGLNN
jgi:hypothetical protein